MESFSAFEDERKRRNWFRSELERQMVQLQRDLTSIHAAVLHPSLEQSRIANNELLNDVQSRLFSFVERAASCMDPLHPTTDVLRKAVADLLIPDPTDNLILHSILADAYARTADAKALLTGNTRDFSTPEVETALQAAAIHKHFTNAAAALGWLGSVRP